MRLVSHMRAIIWDWNGTLFNDEHLAYKAVVSIFKHFNLNPPLLRQYKEEIGMNWMDFYVKYGIPKDTEPEVLQKIRREVFEESWNEPMLRPGTIEVLEQLKVMGISLAIVSGENSDIFKRRIEQYDLRKYFGENMFSGVCDKVSKLKEVLEIFGLGNTPQFSAYVDDSLDGIHAASSLSMKAYGVMTGYAPFWKIIEACPDAFVKEPLDVIQILRDYEICLGFCKNFTERGSSYIYRKCL